MAKQKHELGKLPERAQILPDPSIPANPFSCGAHAAPSEPESADPDKSSRQNDGSPQSDRALIDLCLAGEALAWDALYHRCHESLLAAIRRRLSQHRVPDAELVDEIAARVWYALVRSDGELLDRYNPGLGVRLSSFLAAIARDLMSRHFRSEVRRSRREAVSQQHRPTAAQPGVPDFEFEEFLSALTPAERNFFDAVLAKGEQDPSQAGYSKANAWQLTSRIQKKLRRQLGCDN